MRTLFVASVAVLASYAAFGQQTPPAFEVASVKPAAPDTPIGLFTYPGGRIVATNYTLKLLIHDAYDLETYQILGGPRWVDQDRYQIEAKSPVSSESSKWTPANFKSPPNTEMRRMLQTLLAERFQLQVHRETRKESVYALAAGKGGAKLKEPTKSKQPFVIFGRPGAIYHGAVSLTGENATIAQLAARMATLLKRPVLDQTGLTGHFDFQIEYDGGDARTDAIPSLFKALQEQVNLKLETQPGSIDVLVIDSAEKPSGN